MCGGTFFVFNDYLRPAVRLSAIQKALVTYVMTHDSVAVGEDGPTILVLSRQNLPVLEGTTTDVFGKVAKGGYIVSASEKAIPDGILIATGSEVSLAVQAQKALKEQGQDVRVVSLPSFDLFEQQSAAYKETVLPQAVTKRVAVEAGATFGWERYVGFAGKVIGIDHFGASAPGDRILKEFGFTVENVVNTFNSL